MGLLLNRHSRPKISITFDWRRNLGLDSRPFPWSCFGWLARNAGDDLAERLFRLLIVELKPAFGFITPDAEVRRKHYFQSETPAGVYQKFMGLDVGNTLPGVY